MTDSHLAGVFEDGITLTVGFRLLTAFGTGDTSISD